MECMDRESMRKLQSERLIETVKRCYEKVPFYRRKMDKMGIKPEDIRSIDDIHRLPFTTKHDLRDEYPFGLQAVPQSEVVRIHASSGTTGKPVVGTYTKNDLAMWAEGAARVMAASGVTKGDIVQVSYGYGLFTGGLGAHDAAGLLGAVQLPTSAGNSEKQIMLMKDFGSTVLCCTPSYALHLAEVIEKSETVKKEDLKLKVGFFGAEPWTEGMRKELQERLGIKAIDIYGLTEMCGPGVGGECEYQNGTPLGRSLLSRDHQSRHTRTMRTGRIRRTRLHLALQGGNAYPPLPHPRPHTTHLRQVRVWTYGSAHGPHPRPLRRHDDHPWRQRVPKSDRDMPHRVPCIHRTVFHHR